MAVHRDDTAGLEHKFAKTQTAAGNINCATQINRVDNTIGNGISHRRSTSEKVLTGLTRRP